MNPTREILIAARKEINKPGKWCQHYLHESRWLGLRTRHCMIGAIEAVSYRMTEALMALREALPSNSKMDPPNSKMDLARYNDTPGRTHAEILAVYDRAIAAQPA